MTIKYTIKLDGQVHELLAAGPPVLGIPQGFFDATTDFRVDFRKLNTKHLQVDLVGSSITGDPCCLLGQGPCSKEDDLPIHHTVLLLKKGNPPLKRVDCCVEHTNLVIYFMQNIACCIVGTQADPAFKSYQA